MTAGGSNGGVLSTRGWVSTKSACIYLRYRDFPYHIHFTFSFELDKRVGQAPLDEGREPESSSENFRT